MKTNRFIKGLIALFLFSASTIFAAESNIDKLLQENNIEVLSKLIKETKIIEDEANLPNNPKEHDLIIIENEYDVKVLFEFLNNTWSEKSGKEIANILNDQKSTYMHLFNYKVSGKDFDKYVSDKDSEKVYDDGTEKKLEVKILSSKFSEKAIKSTIKVYSQTQLIGANDIINIQIVNIREEAGQTNCDIIFSYKE